MPNKILGFSLTYTPAHAAGMHAFPLCIFNVHYNLWFMWVGVKYFYDYVIEIEVIVVTS